nr:retrovirus-related Pol polyprotein from transposon TNT 1-94 [Tanacetum cinerariifolium]
MLLDSQTVSGYFIGYPEKSKGYRDDDPSPMNVHKSTTRPAVVPVFQKKEQHLNNEQTPHEEKIDAMKEELKLMAQNKVQDLVNLPEGSKRVGCKWVSKTKRKSKGNVERYKARLVAKCYTQKNSVDYNETFSPVSKKDSLRIILALVAHFDLELHQMDVKTVFLNGNLKEEVYMEQPEGFFIDGKEKMDYMLTYKRSNHLEVVGYVDYDYDGCVGSEKSTFGYVFQLAEGAISHKSAKQSIIAASTKEAEFVACYEATIHALWPRNFILRLGVIDTIS